MNKTITWIVVADHQHVRFFRNEGPNRGIQPLEELSSDTHLRRSRDILTDRPGHAVSARDGRRHSFEPEDDAHRQEGVEFMRHVADVATKAAADGLFSRLILIAPPRALGELRKALPDSLRDKVIGELAEDLTKAPAADILNHLANFIAA